MSNTVRPQPPNANHPITNKVTSIPTYEFNLFLQQMYLALDNNIGELVSSTTISTTAQSLPQTLLCNATGGNITITLPGASHCYSIGKSIKITIVKTDATANTVTISGAGTINGSASKILSSTYATVSIVTDGINWFEV